MEPLVVICPQVEENSRLSAVLAHALEGRPHVKLQRPDQLHPMEGRRVLFAISLLHGGVNLGWYAMLSAIRQDKRFFEGCCGAVLVDGHDVSKVTIHSLRSQMGIMLQDSFIFSGTIADNVRYGRLDATLPEIEAACHVVHADEFIGEMKEGYDTEVKERGGRLSQGQKQLLAFARTIISAPKILILDEATSAIDTKTEQYVQEGIAHLLKGRTSFIIAHRLSTIRDCDRIMYVSNQTVTEYGTHDELMAKKGDYYKLYTAQLAESD